MRESLEVQKSLIGTKNERVGWGMDKKVNTTVYRDCASHRLWSGIGSRAGWKCGFVEKTRFELSPSSSSSPRYRKLMNY